MKTLLFLSLLFASNLSFGSCQDVDVQRFIRDGVDQYLGAKSQHFANAVTYNDLANDAPLGSIYQKPVVQQALRVLSLTVPELAQAIANETNRNCRSNLPLSEFGPMANIGSIQKALGLSVNP